MSDMQNAAFAIGWLTSALGQIAEELRKPSPDPEFIRGVVVASQDMLIVQGLVIPEAVTS